MWLENCAGPKRMSFPRQTVNHWMDVRHAFLLKIYWTIWIPVQTIAFSIVPQHLRISFIAAMSFCG